MVLTNVVLVSPLEANLEIMVLCNDRMELLQQLFRLICVQFVDELWERAQSEDTLPPGDRIGSDNRVNSFELCTHIQRTTTLFLINLDLVRVGSSGFGETIAGKRGCQPFKEFLVDWRESVVDFVTGRPHGISTALWELSQT